MSHYVERFESAVHALIGDGPVKQRLTRAYSEYLAELRDVELPVNLHGALSELHATLNSVAPAGKQSQVNASVQKMSAGDASRCAQTIVRLYADLVLQASRAERPEPLKIVERRDLRRDEQTAPRFLVTGS
jgi:hypothetical protein